MRPFVYPHESKAYGLEKAKGTTYTIQLYREVEVCLYFLVLRCILGLPLWLPNMASGAEGHGFFAGLGELRAQKAEPDVIHM